MKRTLLFLLLFLSSLSFGQKIAFNYDDAGNQIQRYICTSCHSRKTNDTDYKTPESLTDKDLIKDDLYGQISYYPNPVKEELYVKWHNKVDNQVTKIELYSISGQLVKYIPLIIQKHHSKILKLSHYLENQGIMQLGLELELFHLLKHQ